MPNPSTLCISTVPHMNSNASVVGLDLSCREGGGQLTGVRARHFTRRPNHTKMPTTARSSIHSTHPLPLNTAIDQRCSFYEFVWILFLMS